MSKLGYGPKLFGNFVRFALEYKTYWLIPLMLILGAAATVVVVSQGAAPLIYTLF